MDCVYSFYGDDFYKAQLKDQLHLLATMGTDHGYNLPNMTITDFIRFIQSLSAAERHFLSEVATLTKLMLLARGTNVVCERSLSNLKKLKTYLRSTMGDDRLFYLMVIHVRKQLTDNVDLIQVANQFVANIDSRKQMLGTFSRCDMQVKKVFVSQSTQKAY